MKGMPNPLPAPKQVVTHTFTREQVAMHEVAAFASAYSPEKMSQDALRGAYDSLALEFSGFDSEERVLYECPDARAFVGALHDAWPYALFFLNLPAADVKAYLFCRLTGLAVENRAGQRTRKVDFSRNELFQLIGRDFDRLETACQRAGFSPEVFRLRARQILTLFGFLKT